MNEVVILSDSYKRHSKEGQYITNEGITVIHTIQIDKNTKITFKDFELWNDTDDKNIKALKETYEMRIKGLTRWANGINENSRANALKIVEKEKERYESELVTAGLDLFASKLKAINDDLKGGIDIERLGKSIAKEMGICLK
ncbi:MAG: hypothetical protein ACRDD7_11205 [Peptostreptococcaceae bacterium]